MHFVNCQIDLKVIPYFSVFIYYVPEEGTAKSKSLYPCAIDGFIKKLQGYGADIKLRVSFWSMTTTNSCFRVQDFVIISITVAQ